MRKVTKKGATVSHSTLAQAAGASVTDPVPTKRAPSPPKGNVPVTLGRGNRPRRAQVALAPKMAAELRASGDYAAQFGAGAPDASSVADSLETASAWSDSLQNATAWYQYTKQQEHLAWKHALGLTDTLRVPYEFRLSRDATVGESLPSTAKFFGAPKDSAMKAAATRKKNAAAEKPAGAKATASAPADSPPLAPPPAAPAATAKLLN